MIKPATRRDLLRNRLVLVAPASSYISSPSERACPLATLLGGGRLAITENVRAALFLVARGEAPLGIVYATDAAAETGVKVVGVLPEDLHPPIVYPIALTAGGSAAARFRQLPRITRGEAVIRKARIRRSALGLRNDVQNELPGAAASSVGAGQSATGKSL